MEKANMYADRYTKDSHRDYVQAGCPVIGATVIRGGYMAAYTEQESHLSKTRYTIQN